MSSSAQIGLPPEVGQARLSRLRERLQARDLTGAFISNPENRRYLSGFTGSAGWLMITATEALLITDFRYWEQARQQAPQFELVRLTDRLEDLLPELAQRLGEQRIGFEATHITVDEHHRWMSAEGPITWVPERDLVEPLRAVKDTAEIEAIRRAAELTDAALAHGLKRIRPGMPEQELAWLLERYLREHGAEAVAFEIIVAGGVNSARPHARASADPLPAGQPIVIDLGARVDGYCADLTRTICLGEPVDPNTFWTVYNTVQSAQQAALEGMQAGMAGAEVDALAREVIARAGYGDAFGHSLGHGVGLAVHEKPRLGRRSEDRLEPGMVVTVEPGIYLPSWGGVRIEDLVLLKEDGIEVLSQAPKNPIVFGSW